MDDTHRTHRMLSQTHSNKTRPLEVLTTYVKLGHDDSLRIEAVADENAR